jgi:6-phospho-beta-glucosidase
VKVALVGGSAPSTPQLLIEPSLARDPRLGFTLHGRSQARLGMVQRAAVTLEPALAGKVETTTDLADAITDADVVIVQVRVGGLAARAHDECFPLASGVPGDEGLGPGGLAAAWRNWPAVAEVLACVAKRNPGAAVAILTAPLGLLLGCAREAFPALDVVGLCELPTVVLGEIRLALGQAEGLTYAYTGINHLGWFTQLSIDARDALDDYAATRTTDDYPTASDVRAARAVPLPYVRLHDQRENVVAMQRARAARGTVLGEIAASAYEAFDGGDETAIRAALARRPAPWYRRAVAPWIAARRDGTSAEEFFLTTRNAGYLRHVCAGAIVEVPHRVGGGAFIPREPPPDAPARIARTLESLIAYETLAAEVVVRREASQVAGVLATHPWVASNAAAPLARGVLEDWAAANVATGPV